MPTFKEIVKSGDKQAIEKAREELREIATEHDWHDYTKEMWTEALAQIGFEDAKIEFSGFWSQGDGASFTANVNLEKLVNFLSVPIAPSTSVNVVDGEENFIPWIINKIGNCHHRKYNKLLLVSDYINLKCERTSHHYSHEQTCDFNGTFDDNGDVGPAPKYEWKSKQPRLSKLFDQFISDAESLRVALCYAIYKDLEKEYDYITSDEAFLEYELEV